MHAWALFAASVYDVRLLMLIFQPISGCPQFGGGGCSVPARILRQSLGRHNSSLSIASQKRPKKTREISAKITALLVLFLLLCTIVHTITFTAVQEAATTLFCVLTFLLLPSEQTLVVVVGFGRLLLPYYSSVIILGACHRPLIYDQNQASFL